MMRKIEWAIVIVLAALIVLMIVGLVLRLTEQRPRRSFSIPPQNLVSRMETAQASDD